LNKKTSETDCVKFKNVVKSTSGHYSNWEQ